MSGMLLTGTVAYLLVVIGVIVVLGIAVTVRLGMLQRSRKKRLSKQVEPERY